MGFIPAPVEPLPWDGAWFLWNPADGPITLSLPDGQAILSLYFPVTPVFI